MTKKTPADHAHFDAYFLAEGAALFAGVITTAAALTFCMAPPKKDKHEQTVAQQREQRRNILQQSDVVMFRKAGFDIVSRTGVGNCNNAEAGIRDPSDKDNSDMTYILKKSSGGDATYTACATRGYEGLTGIKGLKAVAAYTAPKP